ncbi:MAG: PD-(D/E)XK nuclease family protein [Lachnospiraceae bacterium]|nr:PD-(D/E)XK nuclease family protein [Lachnospiraceae bacterium]
MALEIIYGSAVSGKTEKMHRRLIEQAQADPEGRYCLIVPEQASLAAQEALVRLHPDHALTNIDILTFNRLSYRVFQDLHEDERTILSETGKLMLLRLTAERLSDRLPAIHRNLKREGFLAELKSVVSELAEYNVSPESLSGHAEALTDYPLLRDKLRDISIIYSEFMTLLHRDYEMAEERMKRLAEVLGRWEALPQTTFVFDGFTGFTPLQYEVLKVMLRGARDVVLLSDIGQGKSRETEKNEDDLFYMSAHMAEELRAIAIEAGIPERAVTVPDEEGMRETTTAMPNGAGTQEGAAYSPEIRCIEAGLFNYPRERFTEETDRVRIIRAKDPQAEVRVILSEILRGVRDGLRYREMAVISGTPALYREELTEQLTDAGVPFFFDERKELRENPLVLLTESLLSAPEANFSFDWVFDVVKNPVVSAYLGRTIPDTAVRIAETENYVRAMGIRGKGLWQETWEHRYRHFPEVRLPFVNEVRVAISALLTEITEALSEELPVREKCAYLRAFFEEIGAGEIMQSLSERFADAGNYTLAREYAGTMAAILELLDQAEQILGGLTLSADLFRDVLASGLSDLRLRMVPPTKDRLVIGDVRRSRLSGIRRLFILGANDGRLPETEGSGGLLSDFDREILKENRLTLSPTAREESFFSRFYLYLLFTEPRESLLMTYAASDKDGRALLPAAVVRELQDLFPRVPVENADENSLLYISTKDQGLRSLSGLLRDAEERFRETGERELLPDPAVLYRWFMENGAEEEVRKIEDGLFMRYVPETLTEETAARMFRETVNSSVSRLEKYASCAYGHFLQYGLTLDEREEHELLPTDIGTILHNSLNRFFQKIRERGLSWRSLPEETREALVSESVDEAAESEEKGLLRDTARSRYLRGRLIRITNRTIRVLTEQWKAGEYEETFSEYPFRLTVDRDLLDIRGSIDRLDTYRENGRTYARVIDYKSGRRDLDYTKVWYGLQLQLLIYMEAAREFLSAEDGNEVIAAGTYYYHIDDPLVDADPGKDPELEIRKELRLKGPTNGTPDALRLTAPDDQLSEVISGVRVKKDGSFYKNSTVLSSREFEELGRFARDKALALSGEMTSGRIPVNPYKAEKDNGCTFCPYAGVCGFDERIEGFSKKRLRKKKLSDLTGHPEDLSE